MQLKTSSLEFEKFGSVYEQPIVPEECGMISRDWHLIAKRSVSQLYHFDCEVCLEMQSGMAALIVGDTPDSGQLQVFAVHRLVKLHPGVYFALVAVTSNITCKLITTADYNYSLETLSPPYLFERILPRIRISEILGYYYSIRNSGYHFKGEKHNYFELTYVDRGTLNTDVEGKHYELKEKELIIYGPGQFHTQDIPEGHSCSYVTIIFDMETVVYDAESSHYELLLNKVFGYDKKIYTLIKTFVTESTSQIPYMNSLMLCLLQETVIRLLQSEFIGKKNDRPVTGARQHYQDELLEKILAYIDETIYEPLTIAELCQKFSMSRSSLQILFKENMDISPKKYINEMKLEKSRQMICENKYTISEIALMLGFNSIHYFSRAFTQKYHMAPSEYSKTLYKA
ncbi:helix-turn-helix domain-containing protein [Lachnoclostridium sp. An131]|uniref:helix-turn-helix domain-containing protein n=1 Tax=Lachnoclostridium sp. An131 TaxID=1965555 RepID=UPI0013A61673|nr:AraC family transcriptional regulator [Lachnoclostridium sp. An131]